MKKIIFLATFIILATSTIADDQQNKDLDERIFDARVKQMSLTLQLTEAQKARFVPIYQRYTTEMRKVLTSANHERQSEDAKQQAIIIKERLNRQKHAIDIQSKYIDEFAQVLDAKQLRRFLETERRISKKVKMRSSEAKARKHIKKEQRQAQKEQRKALKEQRQAQRELRHQQRLQRREMRQQQDSKP